MALDLEKTHHWGTVFKQGLPKANVARATDIKMVEQAKANHSIRQGDWTWRGIGQIAKALCVGGLSLCDRSPDTREQDTKKCEDAINSSALSSFVKQLKAVQTLAEDHAKDFKSSTYKKTATALAEILEAGARS